MSNSNAGEVLQRHANEFGYRFAQYFSMLSTHLSAIHPTKHITYMTDADLIEWSDRYTHFLVMHGHRRIA